MTRRFLPFIISLGGIITDVVTTQIGLSLGFYETHLHYHPLLALLVFWGILFLLSMAPPKRGPLNPPLTLSVSLFSYLGTVNNTLVILGLFPGLPVVLAY